LGGGSSTAGGGSEVLDLKTEVPDLKTEVPDLRSGGIQLNLSPAYKQYLNVNQIKYKSIVLSTYMKWIPIDIFLCFVMCLGRVCHGLVQCCPTRGPTVLAKFVRNYIMCKKSSKRQNLT